MDCVFEMIILLRGFLYIYINKEKISSCTQEILCSENKTIWNEELLSSISIEIIKQALLK